MVCLTSCALLCGLQHLNRSEDRTARESVLLGNMLSSCQLHLVGHNLLQFRSK